MTDEMRWVSVAERPDLSERAWELTRDAFPEYNNHADALDAYWGRLVEERAEFQFHLLGDDDEILARARALPLRWDGSVEDLPAGIDGAIARGFDRGRGERPLRALDRRSRGNADGATAPSPCRRCSSSGAGVASRP